jgi:hypothetical protein
VAEVVHQEDGHPLFLTLIQLLHHNQVVQVEVQQPVIQLNKQVGQETRLLLLHLKETLVVQVVVALVILVVVAAVDLVELEIILHQLVHRQVVDKVEQVYQQKSQVQLLQERVVELALEIVLQLLQFLAAVVLLLVMGQRVQTEQLIQEVELVVEVEILLLQQ